MDARLTSCSSLGLDTMPLTGPLIIGALLSPLSGDLRLLSNTIPVGICSVVVFSGSCESGTMATGVGKGGRLSLNKRLVRSRDDARIAVVLSAVEDGCA